METLYRIFGPPHERLHLLALWLIGRRAVAHAQTHVDVPDDLSTGQYIFVAGLPALVFWGIGFVGAALIFSGGLLTLLAGVALLMIGTLAGLGTIGDLLLIFARLTEAKGMPDDENR